MTDAERMLILCRRQVDLYAEVVRDAEERNRRPGKVIDIEEVRIVLHKLRQLERLVAAKVAAESEME